MGTENKRNAFMDGGFKTQDGPWGCGVSTSTKILLVWSFFFFPFFVWKESVPQLVCDWWVLPNHRKKNECKKRNKEKEENIGPKKKNSVVSQQNLQAGAISRDPSSSIGYCQGTLVS